MKGVVKRGAEAPGYKNFGFIISKELDKDIFYHEAGIKRDDNGNFVPLRAGDKVQFEVSENEKGKNAINVEIVKDGADSQE